MGFTKRCLAASVPAAVLLLAPTPCFAGAGAEYLATTLIPLLLNEVLIAFWGISAAFVFYYAVRIIFEAHKDEAGKELATSFIFALTGFAIIAIAGAFGAAFGVGSSGASPATTVAPLALDAGILSVADFIIKMSTGIFVLLVVITGLKMIASQGEASNFDKWRKVLVANAIGIVLMLTAWFIVHAMTDLNSPGLLIAEMKGLALWMLTLIGFIAVAALIVAGIMLIVSVEESLKDRAKKIVIGTLISLLIVVACYTLIIIFIP